MGSVCKKMEQARPRELVLLGKSPGSQISFASDLSLATRVRVVHVDVSAFEILSDLCHFPALGFVSRAGHGCRVQEDPIVSVHDAGERPPSRLLPSPKADNVAQMAQLPMIVIGRIPAVRRNKAAGNIVFWLGLMMGFPLLCVSTALVA